MTPDRLVAVFIGGFFGGLARYEITAAWPSPRGSFPTATLLINLGGAFLLGAIVMLTRNRSVPYLRVALGTGWCGAFTTFGSVMTATDLLVAHGHQALAIGYLLASLGAGLTAVVLGMLSVSGLEAMDRRLGRRSRNAP
ncbi:MAG TPA: CrcB family protein [Mycobacteriales bacterium]|nr:CrcB family protein [Mycobacteriales bacterium]